MRVVCDTSLVPMITKDRDLVICVETTLDSCLRDLELIITSDYYSAFGRLDTPSFKISAEDYLSRKGNAAKASSLLCPEMPLPNKLTSNVGLTVRQRSVFSDQAVALVHAGREGCMTPIHFDWDHKWVAHACLLGRKRFFLFPPDAGWLLSPILNTSALAIPKFSEPDRYELVHKLGGAEIVLEAGQGILFPSMFWHGTLYEEPSLALSVRFELNAGGRPFAVLPRSWFLQRLVWRFFENGYNSTATDFLVKYLKSFFGRSKSWKDRYWKIMDLCQNALIAEREEHGARRWISENFSPELTLASQELKLYYGNVRAREPHENDRIREARKFIFDRLSSVSAARQLLLSKYAVSVRQGLPPKRGLVQIDEE